MSTFTKPLAIAVALGMLAAPALAETYTFGSGVPERSSANRAGVLPLLENIEAATDGDVSFNPILGGQLVSIPGALQAIADGVVDSGFFITQFHAEELPAASLMSEVTGLAIDPYATMGALNEALFVTCEPCREDLRRIGVVPVLTQSATPLTMQCTSEVETMADLAGLRVATIGRPEMRWASSIGMTPVRTRIADILSGLQLGASDCALIGTAWIRSYGLEDTIKSVIEMPQGIISGAVPLAINADVWASMAQEDRDAIVALMPATLWDYVTDAYVTADADVKQALDGKVAFSPGDDALRAAWQDFYAGEADALKELAASRGVENSKALIDAIVEVFRVWHEDLLPQFEGDREAFIRIAEERIFSKYDF
ncbi:hypothetical protein [Oceaniradius stylonematis]|uniref:hypothetical protein n=1 Tax=Oceaniradius stylonematis TaxID=2184161 RepID=UPI00273EAA8B|nr:hypothetical protein [Oceaniradius stylonematis]